MSARTVRFRYALARMWNPFKSYNKVTGYCDHVHCQTLLYNDAIHRHFPDGSSVMGFQWLIECSQRGSR